MKNYKNEKKELELDQIEEELLREELRSHERPMPISGKSVFNVKRLREEKSEKKK